LLLVRGEHLESGWSKFHAMARHLQVRCMNNMTEEHARPIHGILAGTALGAVFWLLVLVVSELLAALS
jgi:hypothetical protein